ncbi:MAG: hypothetical protein GXO22_00195 [Aquificae bacterium]|nr:hypothetical protein [Aquificota bacterium]
MQKITDINVIFLGAGPTALAGIREAGENKFNTYTIGLYPYEVGLYSKYTKKLGYAHPEKEPEKLLNILNKFYGENPNSTNILIPTGDESIEFLSKNKEKLKDRFVYSLLLSDISEIILNKEKFAQICEKYNIPAPKTWTKNTNIPLEEWAKQVKYPCFIKPVYYHKWAKMFGLKKGFLVNSNKELIETYNNLYNKFSELIIQEVIPGDDSNIVVFSANFTKDNVEQIFTGRKIRQYPVNFGTTTCAISENIEEIKEYSIKLLTSIKYIGVCDVEFKYDYRDNTYKIIEVNARIGRWYRLVTKSRKIPLTASIHYLANTNTKLKETQEKENIIWLFPIRDIPAILKQENKLKAIKYYFKRNKVWCIFDKKDPLPFLMYFFEMGYKYIKYKKGK